MSSPIKKNINFTIFLSHNFFFFLIIIFGGGWGTVEPPRCYLCSCLQELFALNASDHTVNGNGGHYGTCFSV